jgi:putative nucleotidyltransferase with HDIG domain
MSRGLYAINQMDRRTRIYIVLVVAAAAVLVVAQFPLSELDALSSDDWKLVGSLLAVALLSQAAAIDFGKGRQASSSVAFIPFLATAIILPPAIAIFVAGSVITISELIFTRRDAAKRAFNVAQITLAIGLSAHVYALLLGEGSRADTYLPGFIALVVTFFAINILLSSGALALYRGQQYVPTLKDVLGPRGGNFIGDLIVSPLVITAVMFARQPGGIFILMLALLFIRRFYLAERKLYEANTDLLTVLVKAIETRDPYTSGHSIRVSTLSTLIAEDMKLSWRRIAKTRKAALLHDIGKIDPIYSDVLAKPFDLTPAERELIQTHAAKGADLLLDLNSVDAEIIATVRHHHERYDGKGYPDGLIGEAIPLAARIIMMSDSIDAMLSDRPYRKALTIDQVKSELIRCSGSQFDPRIVQSVLEAATLEKALALVDEWKVLTDRREVEQAQRLHSTADKAYA